MMKLNNGRSSDLLLLQRLPGSLLQSEDRTSGSKECRNASPLKGDEAYSYGDSS